MSIDDTNADKRIHPDLQQLFARADELRAQGLDFVQANGLAYLEQRVHKWPAAWGNVLRVLVYGDFRVPDHDLEFPELRIRVLAAEQKGTVITGALTVLEAHVDVTDKTLSALLDASKRLNVLIGMWALTAWAPGTAGWWSYLTHAGAGGAISQIDADASRKAIDGALQLQPDVRHKIDAALYWIRATPLLISQSHDHDVVLRQYAALWNAFECLVEAVRLAVPPPKLSRTAKQAEIDAFLAPRGGRLTAEDAIELYQRIVNPGFIGKAEYALQTCFAAEADRYIRECFRSQPVGDRLYAIRNAINHGDIDANDPKEIIRLQARMSRLWIIVWRMFGRFIPFRAPADWTGDAV